MMLRKNKEECHFEYDMNPYESFMRNHLKHYGYYSGKNQTYRTGKVYEDWQKNHDYPISDQSETEYENQALEDDKSDQDYRPGEDEKKSTQITYSYQAGKMVPKLREPRNLYALNKEYGPQQAPRWPAEMEVLPDRIFHVSVVPNFEEPFYVPTGLEKTPHHPTDGDGKVVYYNPPTKEAYFLRSRVGGSKHSCPFRGIKLKSEEDTTLLFESRFESGNLMKATKVGEYEYNLLLRYDMYTNKHTQWFYFQVKNVKPGVRYRFTITNFLKSGSLYNMGMKPLMYSEKDAETKGRGWRRIGQDIKYYKNNIQRTDLKGEKYFYSLTWTCVFQNADDTCYLAHCYPYTYSHLQDYLLNLSNDPVKNKFCKVRVLCRSLAGNCVYILTITSPSKHPSDAKTKKAVVLTARVHPGETNSSWMMKGFLDYLTGNSADAKLLRDTFVFKIVPMLNPDGVIVGNYRCSLSGRDLNRNYKSILKDSFPSVAHTKNMIKKLQDEREIIMYCDLHGHSRKQNVFIYGCDNKRIASRRLRERIFPVILGRNAPEKFNYNSCKFKVQKSKEGTGRVVIWQMGILNSFTMEATFCGSSLGSRSKTHFNTKDFEAMGYHFCDSLLDLCDPDISKYEQILDELKEKMRQEILAHLQRTGSPMPENGIVNLSDDYTSAIESSTSGSDSSVDDGLPVHLLALAPKLSKKKKLRSRKERDKKRKSLEKAAEKLAKEKAGENAKDSKEKTTPTSKTDKKKDKTMRYRHTDRLSSAGKRSITPGRNDGVPMFVQERCEERQLKKTEYLEAITNAYLMSGVLPPAAQDQSTFHYSQGNHGLTATGVPLGHVEGVCPHHEKAFAEHYVANQLADLQFADEKFDWTHSVVDTRKSVQSLSHRAPSPFQNRPYNKQISMSMVPNEKVVPIGQPQMTGRRSGSPLKRQPMLTDDSQNYAEVITKAFTAKPLTRSRCPSATNIHVYNGRTNSGKPQLMTRSSSKQLLRGNSHYIERTETPMQGPRPSSSIEQTSYVEMNQLVKSTTSQTNITNASKASRIQFIRQMVEFPLSVHPNSLQLNRKINPAYVPQQ
ncbi:cytosolic carboxypeptidase 2-like isoform X2 [Antedon mediterranea]|uniref:cytosolic carboxypeptidase 2-like isoform X2 n=1 Tax=Antedon mediterranea TaxID=105859 RepID=UPI003AF950D8